MSQKGTVKLPTMQEWSDAIAKGLRDMDAKIRPAVAQLRKEYDKEFRK